MKNTDDLSDIRARLDAVTESVGLDWSIEEHGFHGPSPQYALYAGRRADAHGYNLVHLTEWAHQRPVVEAMIVNAPSDIARLLARVEALEDDRDQAISVLKILTELSRKPETVCPEAFLRADPDGEQAGEARRLMAMMRPNMDKENS